MPLVTCRHLVNKLYLIKVWIVKVLGSDCACLCWVAPNFNCRWWLHDTRGSRCWTFDENSYNCDKVEFRRNCLNQSFKDCFSNSRNIVGKKLAVFVSTCRCWSARRRQRGERRPVILKLANLFVYWERCLCVILSLPEAFVVPDVELCGVTVCRSSRCRLGQCQPLVSTWTVVLRCVRRRRSTCVIFGVWTAIVLTLLDLEVTFRFVGRGRRV